MCQNRLLAYYSRNGYRPNVCEESLFALAGLR